ncbi:MAG: PHP domain-containing protein [Armatimonadota bacterium]
MSKSIVVSALVFALFTSVSEADSVQASNIGRKTHNFPKVGKYQVLLADFHMHTTYSDGKLKPSERVLESWNMGYDVIAITDHGNFKAFSEAEPVAESLGLVLIRGLETGVNSKEHMVALGVAKDYVPEKPHVWSDTPEGAPYYRNELTKLDEQGAIVFYAHPHVGFREPVQWGVDQKLICSLEVKNEIVGSGWNTTKSHDTYCYPEAFDRALAHNIGVLATSDAHSARSSNPPVTILFAKNRTKKAVMDAVKSGRTIAWFDGMLWADKDQVEPLISSIISVKPIKGGNGDIIIKNQSPVNLKAKIIYTGITTEIGPYAEVLVKNKELAASVDIEWTNVWIDSKTTLKTNIAYK